MSILFKTLFLSMCVFWTTALSAEVTEWQDRLWVHQPFPGLFTSPVYIDFEGEAAAQIYDLIHQANGEKTISQRPAWGEAVRGAGILCRRQEERSKCGMKLVYTADPYGFGARPHVSSDVQQTPSTFDFDRDQVQEGTLSARWLASLNSFVITITGTQAEQIYKGLASVGGQETAVSPQESFNYALTENGVLGMVCQKFRAADKEEAKHVCQFQVMVKTEKTAQGETVKSVGVVSQVLMAAPQGGVGN